MQTAKAYQDYDEELDLAERGMSELAATRFAAYELSRRVQAEHRSFLVPPVRKSRLSLDILPFLAFMEEGKPLRLEVVETRNQAALSKMRLLANVMIAMGAIGIVGASIWLGVSFGSGDATIFVRALTAQILAAVFGLLGYTLARSVRRIMRVEAQGERRAYGERFFYAATQ